MDDFNPAYQTKTLQPVPPALSGMSTQFGNRFFDNSMLDLFRVCPRKFYYRAIRHWELDGEKVALIFGSSWHASMDYVWTNPDCTLDQAFKAFQDVWNPKMEGKEDFDLFPRTPARAKEMLDDYLKRYRTFLRNIKLVAVEKPFIVPLSEEFQNLFYIGKWDKLYKDGNYLYITDHKTSSSFASTWLNSWSPNGQVDGYLFAGHMEYGEQFKGVMIDGALVQKTKIDFLKIPVERQSDMLDNWKWEVLEWIGWIKYYEELLLQERQLVKSGNGSNFLRSFPKCTTSCTSYYGSCPYLNLCKFVTNPDLISEPPMGYIESEWKPFLISETIEGKFEITENQHT